MSTKNEQQDSSPPIIETKPLFKGLGRYFDNKKDAEDFIKEVDRVKKDSSPPIIETKPLFKVLGRHFDNKKDAEDFIKEVDRVKKVKQENIKKIEDAKQSVVCIEKEGEVDLVVDEQQWEGSVDLVSVWGDDKVSNWEIPITIIDDATYINKLFTQLENNMSVDADSIKSGIFATLTVMERCSNTEHKKFLQLLAQITIYPVYVDQR